MMMDEGCFSINKVIGDLSFIETFGSSIAPALQNEDLRIKTHLTFIESFLRSVPFDGY